MNFLGNIPSGIMNFISIFGTIASLFSIFVASSIPKAIKKYRIQEAMVEINIGSIKKLKNIRSKLELGEQNEFELKYFDFTYEVNEIISCYNSASKNFSFEYKKEITRLNQKYKSIVETNEPFTKIPSEKYIELIFWIDEYCQVIENINITSEKPPTYIKTIGITSGGNNNGKHK